MKKGKKKKDITIPIIPTRTYSVQRFEPPRSGQSYFPSGDSVSDALLCISSSLLFSFVGCFHFSLVYILLRVITFLFGYLSDQPLSWYRRCPSSPSRRTHAHANPQLLCTLFPLYYPFHLLIFVLSLSLSYISREIPERCRGTGQPSPEGTVDGEPVVLRPSPQ